MTFERQQRVGAVWGWLPTFRAAAEYESLQRASLALGVSVSAVSRTIKQLETRLGYAVFVRLKSGVRLTPRGQALLDATRAGMRLVDDVLSPVDTWRVSAEGPFLPVVAAAMPTEHCELVAAPRAELLVGALQRGELDLFVGTVPLRKSSLETAELGVLAMVRAVPPGAEPHAELRHLQGDDLQANLVLARRRKQPLVVPSGFVPEGWGRESASSLPLFAMTRTGGVSRAKAILDALRLVVRTGVSLPLPAPAGRGSG